MARYGFEFAESDSSNSRSEMSAFRPWDPQSGGVLQEAPDVANLSFYEDVRFDRFDRFHCLLRSAHSVVQRLLGSVENNEVEATPASYPG